MKNRLMAALAAVIVFSAPVTAEAVEGKIIKSWYSENHFSAFLRLPYDNLSVSDINAGGTKTELTDFRKTDEGDRVHTSVLITPGGESLTSGILRELLSVSGENELFRLFSFTGNETEQLCDLTSNQMKILDAAENTEPAAEQADLYQLLCDYQEKYYNPEENVFDRLIVFTSSAEVNLTDTRLKSGCSDIQVYFIVTDGDMLYEKNLTSLGGCLGYCSVSSESDCEKAAQMASDMSDIYFLSTELSDEAIGTGGEKRISISLHGDEADIALEKTVDTGDRRSEIAEKSVKNLKTLVALVSAAAAALAIAFVVLLRKKKISASPEKSTAAEQPHVTVPLSRKNSSIGTILSTVSTRILFRENTEQKITLTETGNPQHVIEISSAKETVIGRNQSMSDVIIYNERSVSQKHCRIFSRNSKIYIEDLGSLNHTYVDGEEVTEETELFSGSVLKIGRVVFDVRITPVI